MLNAINRFRFISFMEGLSYVILLFIAMPLKYLADNPFAVKIVGMGHGILFILFVVFLVETMRKHNFSYLFSSKLFVASLLPFGTFFLDKKLRNYKN